MLKVLIAEDDLIIADLIEETLIRNNYEVCGIARSVALAVDLARRHRPDLAVVDLRLVDGLGTEIIEQMGVERPAVLYATGNLSQVDLSTADGEGCLVKPFRTTDLLRCLDIVLAVKQKLPPLKPFPRGFHLLSAAAVPVDPPAARRLS